MQEEAREVSKTHGARFEEARQRRKEMTTDEPGKLRAQHHTEAVLFDVPAHDVFSVWSEVIADREDPAAPVGLSRRIA